MLKLKRLSILLVVAVTIILGVVSCTHDTWDSYTLNNQITMDYPSGWLVDYFDGSGNPTARLIYTFISLFAETSAPIALIIE